MINFSVNFKGSLTELYKTCQIKRKDGFKKQVIDAEIYNTVKKDSFEKYELINNGKLLGDIEIENNPDSVFIINLESYGRKKYGGIGTNLLQVAVEKSLEGYKSGQVTLNAQKLYKIQRNPKKFYKKMGFVQSENDYVQEQIFGIPMKLDVNKSPFWIKKL